MVGMAESFSDHNEVTVYDLCLLCVDPLPVQHEGCGERNAHVLGLFCVPRKVAQAAGLVCRAGVSAEEQGREEGEAG